MRIFIHKTCYFSEMYFEKRKVWISTLHWFSILLLSLTSRIFCEQVIIFTVFLGRKLIFLLHIDLLQANDVAAFQKLFMAKRIEQLAAVKNIQKLEESKRKILLDQISAKLFQVMQ